MATAIATYRNRSEKFETLGAFLAAVALDGLGLGKDPRLEAAAGADEHHGGSFSHGGAAVPVEFIPQILRLGQDDLVLGQVTRVRMRFGRAVIPARTDKNHSSSVVGGITVARRPETVAVTASRGALEQIGLNAVTLAGLVYVTEELMSDSPEVMAVYLETAFRDAVVGALMRELINGTGVGEFAGLLASAATILIAKEGGQAADTINGTNIRKMALQTWNYDSAIWLANPDTRLQLTAAHVTGTSGDKFLYEEPKTEDGPPRLLGRPLVFTEHCPKLGDVGDLISFAPREFLIGDRSEELIDSPDVRFDSAERAIRFTVRNDGQPWWRSALTPANGANTLSPYVTLAERA